jgi:inorganic pyrophosphatase
MKDTSKARLEDPPSVEVLVEISRGSFVKRKSSGAVDFISFFPCPFNYGSVLAYAAADGDPLDAVVLGPHLPRGTRTTMPVLGAIALIDHGVCDDKLICSHIPIGPIKRLFILLFFKFYSVCKRALYLLRGSRTSNRCQGWCDAKTAISRAQSMSCDGHNNTDNAYPVN